ncbi:hypothetical protein TNCV_2486461 [Trichonephila clavipes]|uniref:Uncharacterized protein n=1 Tax=Trichonephila clavipes TaxID=2585209 RepID=A0A8X6W0C9_TRICX|nr:hypothetical protein TNCV_2486461 [Trichonephila clavipes]
MRVWLRVRPRPKSAGFHDGGNRQRCRIIMGHVKDPLGACLVWVRSAKLNSYIWFRTVRTQVSSSGINLGVKIIVAIGMPLIWCHTAKSYQLQENVLGLQRQGTNPRPH